MQAFGTDQEPALAPPISPAASQASRSWLVRRGGPLVLEAALLAGLLSLYRLGRYLSRDHVTVAFDHARAVLHVESRLGLGIEADVQRVVLEHTWLVSALNEYYVRAHFPVTVAFLVITYVRAPELYRHMRRLFVVVTGLGLALHVAYPLAPPRMMPGFVDTVARYGPSIYGRDDVASVANQYAAMPSMHFAWAVLVAYGLLRATRRPWRWLAITHPVITLVAITVTANHYWLDAAAAAALIGVALLVVNRSSPLRTPAYAGATSSRFITVSAMREWCLQRLTGGDHSVGACGDRRAGQPSVEGS